jgi:Peptidoglycan-synthase activator LpoB
METAMQSRSFAGKVFAKWPLLSAAGLLAGVAGCHTDRPHDYGQQRPSVYDLDSRDRGLQSKDANEAADQMAADLLSLPALNRSKDQWTIVTTPVDDQTIDRQGRANYNIFIQALQDRLARGSEGRVTLIANKQDFYKKRSDELEGGGGDEFGQTGGDTPGAGAAVSPDYSLDGVVMDMPNRGTNYYQIQFRLTNLRNRTIPWTRVYPVKVAR